RFRRRLALRATVPAQAVAAAWREPVTTLWLGRKAHLVHYPMRGGEVVNIIAIVGHGTEVRGWDTPAGGDTALRHFRRWCAPARELLDAVPAWRTWSLYDLAPFQPWGRGPVTLVGDAAHPMLPFLAQGGAMAIEDAGVLALCIARSPDDLATAFRAYEDDRYARTARATAAAARNGAIYHLPAPLSSARNVVMRSLGGGRLRARYDWLYDWRDA
ncbi:MAG TPA: FAD-dependent monooxygenase, partial [Xanthobacteraceae bacterium]